MTESAPVGPPSWLPSGAHALFARIIVRRLALGREVHVDVVGIVARVVFDAAEAQRAGTATPEAVQRARRYAAREGLIAPGRERFGAVNADGADTDLAALLEP